MMATLQLYVASALVFFLACAGLGLGYLLQRRALKKRCVDCHCLPGADQAQGLCLPRRRQDGEGRA